MYHAYSAILRYFKFYSLYDLILRGVFTVNAMLFSIFKKFKTSVALRVLCRPVAVFRGVVPLRHLRHVPPPQYCDCGPDWPLLFKVHEI